MMASCWPSVADPQRPASRNFAAIGPRAIPSITAGTTGIISIDVDRSAGHGKPTCFTQVPYLLYLHRDKTIENDESTFKKVSLAKAVFSKVRE